ncbi:mucin-5AC-like [Megalops cyprinoides]|uniref:mucin-5AC-like n=1 Tax=Megalops cyprinoides TaxID=118141 RepID=UPI001864ABC0|nr:mucin-5AC-like [Megalops cyprinoides]
MKTLHKLILSCFVATLFTSVAMAESTATMPSSASDETSSPGATGVSVVTAEEGSGGDGHSSTVDTSTSASTELAGAMESTPTTPAPEVDTTLSPSAAISSPESTTGRPAITANYTTMGSHTATADNLSVPHTTPENAPATATEKSDVTIMEIGTGTGHSPPAVLTPLQNDPTTPTVISDLSSMTETHTPSVIPTTTENSSTTSSASLGQTSTDMAASHNFSVSSTTLEDNPTTSSAIVKQATKITDMVATHNSPAALTSGETHSLTPTNTSDPATVTEHSTSSITEGSTAAVTEGSTAAITEGSTATVTESSTATITEGSTAAKNPSAVPTLSKYTSSARVTITNPATLTTGTILTPSPMASPTSPQNNQTAPYSPSVYAPTEISTMPATLTTASVTSPENDTSTSSVTVVLPTTGTDKAQTSTPIASPASPQNSPITPHSTSMYTSMEPSTFSVHSYITSPTSPKQNPTASSTSKPTTMERVTTSDHNPLASPTFPESHSTMAGTDSGTMTSRNNTPGLTSPESRPTITTTVVMEMGTTPSQNHTAFPASPAMTTQDVVNKRTDTSHFQSHTTTRLALESTPATPSGTPDNSSPKQDTNQSVITATTTNESNTGAAGTQVTAVSPSKSSTSLTTGISEPSFTSTSSLDSTSAASTSSGVPVPVGTSHSSALSTTKDSPPDDQTSPDTFSTAQPTENDTYPTEPDSDPTLTPSTTPTTTRPAGSCSSHSCPFDSTCENLFTGFRCLCLPGSFHSGDRCVQAKVFPGIMRLTSIPFEDDMTNKLSQIFLDATKDISEMLRVTLRNQPGYLKSTVLELRQGSVIATVENIFHRTSNVTQESTSTAIATAIQECGGGCGLLARAEFSATNLCSQEPGPCDSVTTDCSYSADGIATCSCKPGYINSRFSNRSCIACPSGQKAENGKCVVCPFGYAGFDCNDSSLLAAVVISCVLGGLLLILFLAFIIYCWRRPRKEADCSSPYKDEDFRNMWPSKDILPIPRATLNWDPAQIEMTESDSNTQLARKSLVNGMTGSYDGMEDLKTFKGKHTTRYSYLVQGHENPYFLAEDERKAK